MENNDDVDETRCACPVDLRGCADPHHDTQPMAVQRDRTGELALKLRMALVLGRGAHALCCHPNDG